MGPGEPPQLSLETFYLNLSKYRNGAPVKTAT